jgi:hypothetical protein
MIPIIAMKLIDFADKGNPITIPMIPSGMEERIAIGFRTLFMVKASIEKIPKVAKSPALARDAIDLFVSFSSPPKTSECPGYFSDIYYPNFSKIRAFASVDVILRMSTLGN